MQKLILLLLFTSLAFPKNLLWEVEEGNAKIYVTGSIHYGLDDFYPLPNALDSTFNISDYLVLEINMDSLKSKAMKMMSMMMLPAGKSLKTELSPQVYEKLEKAFEGTALPFAQLQQFKPWAAAMTLTQLKVTTEGMNPDKGIDQYFFKKAKASSKAILQLESVGSQMAIFDSFNDMSDKFVLKTIESMNDDMSMLDEMIKAWKDADLKKLDEIINSDDDDDDFKKINELMLDKRNFKMMDKLADYLKTDKTYFVVVGAGHLSGENGLINLLKKKYKVKQL